MSRAAAGRSPEWVRVFSGGGSPVKAVLSGTAKSVKDALLDKTGSLLGGGKGHAPGDKKVTNIVEVIDVGVPLRTAYDHWTHYEKFSGFTKGVRNVSRSDETTSDWKAKVGPSTRGWKATVQEQVPDERIVWRSEGPKGTTRGAVSFHELAPGLTRIVLVVEYFASGLFEKTGNLWRAQGRRLRLDLNGVSPHRAKPRTRGSTGRRTPRPLAERRHFDDTSVTAAVTLYADSVLQADHRFATGLRRARGR
ncbi:SRPBCC family protein [Streptomyces sp. MMS24-I29]|uniref:SRPBCC family protein n=1 Tax=Streptomyces sp. MMS24-I29 TaxID=3351480 RepID=UPI003C7A8EC3